MVAEARSAMSHGPPSRSPVSIAGPVGALLGELEIPPGEHPRAVAVVCHPHPLHGGSMRNAIVVRMARAMRAAGFATLRFDFRGVGGSSGSHDGAREVEDAAAAADHLARAFPELPRWSAGYSFGARIAAELAAREDVVEGLILVAFPCALYDPGILARLRQPGLLVLGERDPFGSLADLERRLPERPSSLTVREIPGADHLFRGRTPLVEEAVRDYARAALVS
jgi:hypothetical protein